MNRKIQLLGAILILLLQIQFTIQSPTNFTFDLLHHDSKHTQFHNKSLSPSFTIDLIHRDSKHSPFYNKSLSPSEVLRKSVISSNARLHHHIASRNKKIVASVARPPIFKYDMIYLLKFYLGTPPVELFALADTGSNVFWIQCSHCDKCFDPSKSCTYNPLQCTSQTCRSSNYYCDNQNLCIYDSRYWNGKLYSKGVLSTDILSFDSCTGSLTSFQNSIFGCGKDFKGDFFFDGPSAGIAGLGPGPLSLVSQLGPLIDYKFAHCLLHHSSKYTSKLRFGADAFSSVSGILSTPLVSTNDKSHYPVTLKSISVGERTTKTLKGEGNIVIDSGTSITYLPQEIYNEVVHFVRRIVRLQQVRDPTNLFNLCFPEGYISLDQFPSMKFHFDGVAVTLPPTNVFESYNNMICMTILPSEIEISIFGGLAQVDMLIGYDLREEKIYFGQTDCTRY